MTRPTDIASTADERHTPRRIGQPHEDKPSRPGPSPDSTHATGPHAPFDADSGAEAERVRQMADTPVDPR